VLPKIACTLAISLFLVSLCGCEDQREQSSNPQETDRSSTSGATNDATSERPIENEQRSDSKPEAAVGMFLESIDMRFSQGDWEHIQQLAQLSDWKPIPSEWHAVLQSEVGWIRDNAMLFGIDLINDSCAVAFVVPNAEGDAAFQEVIRSLQRSVTLSELYQSNELSQETLLYAAVKDDRRLGLISLTHGTHSTNTGAISMGFVHWARAVEELPKLEGTFLRMESN